MNILLKYGCDVNLKDADSRTTLYILALENKMKIVKYLLEHSNINVNIPDSEGRTALHVAAWQGHLEMVKVLITQGKIYSFSFCCENIVSAFGKLYISINAKTIKEKLTE